MIRVVRFSRILILAMSACMHHTPSFDNPKKAPTLVHEVIPGKVFAGEGTTAKGEPIYFGIELLEKGVNLDEWSLYKTKSIALPGKYFPCYEDHEDKPPIIELDSSGFTEQALQQFLRQRNKRFSSWDQERMHRFVSAFLGGVQGLEFSDNSCYIAYFSKVPITGYFRHPAAVYQSRHGVDRVYRTLSLGSFHRGYRNLLMAVRCEDIVGTPVYNNRGIARSLTSLVEGTHAGISIKLHAFTASFFSTFKGKTHMSVAPMSKMFRTLKKALGDHLMVEENIPKELNHFTDFGGGMDTKCVVSCDALVKHL